MAEYINQLRVMREAGYLVYERGLRLSEAEKLRRKLMADDVKCRRLGGTGNYSNVKVYPVSVLEQGSIHNPCVKTEYGVFVRPLPQV